MAVNAYDSRQAFRQDAIARLGEKAMGTKEMTAGDRQKFNASPFMQQMKAVEGASLEKLSARDKKRQQTDPSFKPSDDDLNTPKTVDYSKTIDYYGVLGLDEYATLEEIKKTYKTLCLSYHPDKLTGKTQEEKDEAAVVFLELKNAYKLLSDSPTRRQYDYDRDRDAVSSEMNGHRAKKPEPTINAAELLKQLQERAARNKANGSKLVKVEAQCKLEKFIYGGHKSIERARQVKDKMEYSGFREDYQLYRIDIPQRSCFPYTSLFRRAGDQYLDQEADSIEFILKPKPHPSVIVEGNDLVLHHERLLIDPCVGTIGPFLRAEATVLLGRHIMLWGRNPFYACRSKRAVLQVNIHGEGANCDGALKMRATINLEARENAAPLPRRRSRRLPESGKKFLQDFGLEPPWKLRHVECDEDRAEASMPSMQRHIGRKDADESRCEIELACVGQPLILFTKPPCTVTFYMNRKATDLTPLLAISMTAPACASKKGAASWLRLKEKVAPLLQSFGLFMVRTALLRILLRPLEPTYGLKVLPRRGSALNRQKHPEGKGWKSCGDAALLRGDVWHALQCYSLSLRELHESDALLPKVLSNRANCFAKIGDFNASLADAKRATELEPAWSRGWTRVGLAAWKLYGASNSDALDAHMTAVQLEPSDANVQSLQLVAGRMEGPNEDAAHELKEKGNMAMRVKEYSEAIAAYTMAIGKLPESPEMGAAEQLSNPLSEPVLADPCALLRAILFSNRAAAFVFLQRFDAAVTDGRAAVGSSPHFVKGRCHLGVALLGKGMFEQAYVEFAKAVQLEPENSRAAKGRKACLREFLLMRSLPRRLRIHNRFNLDLQRPKGSTRIFAISDVHCDRPGMEEWIHAIDSYLFQDDIIIVAGNLAVSIDHVQRGLSVLKSKFRRVFYTIGNFEAMLAISEWGKYPDSIAKINAIFEACDKLCVDVYPAPVCEGLFVVPLLSWYNAEFDEKDPVPNGRIGMDDRAKWPMDPDMQLSKYMIKLNEAHLQRPFYGTVISFSHFLPRKELPLDPEVAGMVKTCGCTDIDEQARRINSKLHVFGHSGQEYAQAHNGIKYVQCPVAHMKSRHPETEPRLMMVHNGKELCMQEWGADGEPPLGFIKRIQHTAFYVANGITVAKKRELGQMAEKMNKMAGVEVAFTDIGSNRLTRKEFEKEIWPEMSKLEPFGATCALHIVADNTEALKNCLASPCYRTDFAKNMSQVSSGQLVIDAPLGMDLVHAGKGRDDPTLILFALRLFAPRKDAHIFEEQIEKVIASINAPSFSAGKLCAGWQKVGITGMETKDWAKELGTPELTDSGGMTHLLTFYVNNPDAFKAVTGSKTFNRLRSIYAPHLRTLKLGQVELPGELVYVIPLEFSVTAAAPKPAKKTGPRRPR